MINKFLWVCLIPLAAHGQIIQAARFEASIDWQSNFRLLPWGKQGTLIYKREDNGTNDKLHFLKTDTLLQESWTQSINVSKSLSLAYAKTYNDRAYFLFRPNRGYGDFQLLALNIDTAKNLLYTIKNIIPFNPTLFEVGVKTVVVAGYYNYRPVAIHFSMETGESRLLPGFFNEPGELNQLHINEDETTDIVINMKNSDRKKNLWIMNFGADGHSIKNTIINPTIDRNLIYGRMVKSNSDTIIVAGVYGKNAEMSRGVFVASINTAGEYSIRYYNFAELRNFFKFMRVTRQNRIKERIERKKIKGKKVKFNYRIAVHEFVKYQDQLVLLGEAFYPIYKSGLYSTQGGYLNPAYSRLNYLNYSQNALQFDGYQYTHAVIIGIAKNGKLLWDNSFEIKDVKSYTLDQFVHLVPGKNLALLYSFNSKLYTKIIQGSEVIEGKNEDVIAGRFETDKATKNGGGEHHLEYWYGKYLLSYGVQELKNQQTANVPLVRKVFYINKVTFKE